MKEKTNKELKEKTSHTPLVGKFKTFHTFGFLLVLVSFPFMLLNFAVTNYFAEESNITFFLISLSWVILSFLGFIYGIALMFKVKEITLEFSGGMK